MDQNQNVHSALGGRDFLLKAFQLIGCAGTLAFGCSHVFAQCVNLAAQFFQVSLFLGDLGRAWRRSAFLLALSDAAWGVEAQRQSQENQRQSVCWAGFGARFWW